MQDHPKVSPSLLWGAQLWRWGTGRGGGSSGRPGVLPSFHPWATWLWRVILCVSLPSISRTIFRKMLKFSLIKAESIYSCTFLRVFICLFVFQPKSHSKRLHWFSIWYFSSQNVKKKKRGGGEDGEGEWLSHRRHWAKFQFPMFDTSQRYCLVCVYSFWLFTNSTFQAVDNTRMCIILVRFPSWDVNTIVYTHARRVPASKCLLTFGI